MKSRLIILLLTAFSGSLYAQEQVVPNERKQRTVITEPATLYKGFLRANLSTNFYIIDKYFDGSGTKQYLLGDAGAFSSSFSFDGLYGVTDRLQLAVTLPYQSSSLTQSIYYEIPDSNPQGNTSGTSTWKQQGSGLGDIILTTKYQLWTETATRPAITSAVAVYFPTGEKNPTNIDPKNPRSFSPAVGNGCFEIDANIGFRRVKYPYSYSLYFDYAYHFAGEKIFHPGEPLTKFKSSDLVSLIGSFNFNLNDWIALQNEIDYFQYLNNGTMDGQKVDLPVYFVQYTPKISFQIKRLRLIQGIFIPLMGKNTGADNSFFLLVQYTF